MLASEIEQLKQYIESKMKHKYVDIYIHRPEIDELALELLFYASCSDEVNEQQTRTFITATMLVQTALNAHELVKNEGNYLINDEQKKEKQLLVLAGDYYSGLYYLLLSEIKDVRMVGILAKGIKEVNEKKMQLYYSEFTTKEELINLLLGIHTTVITHISRHLFQNSVANLIERVSQLHFLLQELNQEESTLHFYLKQQAIHVEENILHTLHAHIREYIHEIEKQLNHDGTIPSSLKQIVQQYFNHEVYDLSTAAEEG